VSSAGLAAAARPRLARGVLAAVVAAVSFALLAAGIRVAPAGDAPPFDPDEAAKISDAYYYHLLVDRRALDDPAWSEGFYARTTPTVGKLLFGAALAAAGERVEDLALQHGFDALWRDPAELRRHVPDAWLRTARLAAALCGALAAAALALVASGLGGLVAGVAAACLLLGHAGFARVSGQALTDAPLLFWLAAAPLVFAPALRALARPGGGPRGPRAVLALGLSAVLAPAGLVALAAGTKPNGALAAVAYALALAGAAFAGGRRGLARRLAGAAAVASLAAAAALALFVAANPYLYAEPLAKLVAGAAVWRDWMLKQQIDPGGALYGAGQQLALAVHLTLRSGELPLVRAFGDPGRWLGIGLFAAGVATLTARMTSAARRRDPAALVVAAWAATLVLGVALSLPIVRGKYLLPAYLPVCVVQALGAAALLRLPGRARAARDGERSAAGPGRTATPVAVGLGAALLLAPGSPLVDASLLHPILVPDAFRGARLAGYREGVAAHPDSPVRRYHLAIAYGVRGRFAEGASELEAALAGLAADGGDTSARVLRADALFGLAQYRAALGDREAAARALAEHLAELEGLRDAMRSHDPFVRAEFDVSIALRRDALQGHGEAAAAQRAGGARSP
jgi:tetratricopeptide (TPR) repeat protein